MEDNAIFVYMNTYQIVFFFRFIHNYRLISVFALIFALCLKIGGVPYDFFFFFFFAFYFAINALKKLIAFTAVNETQGLEFDFNYGMTQFPEFNEDFVELYHRGTTYYMEDRHEPPFQPEVIPEYLNHTEKMIYIYVSDYVLNSAFYAGYLSGHMAFNVTPDLVSVLFLMIFFSCNVIFWAHFFIHIELSSES